MEIPAGIAAEAALTQQAIALKVIKQNADAEKAIANILDASLSVGPAVRGSRVDMAA